MSIKKPWRPGFSHILYFSDEEAESQELRGPLRIVPKLDTRNLVRFTFSLLSATFKLKKKKPPSDDGIQYLFHGKNVKFGELK